MENYAKVILYTYPLLKTVGKDYAEHIRNKALLSYDSAWDTERLTEYLAEEILRKKRLEWLKNVVEGVLDKLNDTEKALVEIRYFGKKSKLRSLVGRKVRCDGGVKEKRGADENRLWSERAYFRRQRKLAEKLERMLCAAGMTREVYLKEFAPLDIFERTNRFIEQGRDIRGFANERKWLQGA